jgi:GTP-binding protein
MLPVIALVGRPNVGKSTLFNVLTRTRDALVADVPGLTRDRQYGLGRLGKRPYIIVDTGGLNDSGGLDGMVALQALQAVEEADAVLFMVDGRGGLTGADQEIAQQLRQLGKDLYLVVNKTEFLDTHVAIVDFHTLGLGELHAISATHRRGVHTLIDRVLDDIQQQDSWPEAAGPETQTEQVGNGIRLAVVGRPNVGKSTFINRLLGEERVLVFDEPGTTRDSVEIPFTREGQHYTLIDTAGVRRRSRVHETIEKFSVIKTLQAIEQAHVVVMMIDARQGIGEQDATLLGYILDSGRALVLAINKWDRLDPDVRNNIRSELARKLAFIDFAEVHYISALYGSGVMDVLAAVNTAYAAATRKLSTPELTRMLEAAVAAHQPPLVRGWNIKLRYAHQGGQNPPIIIIHGNRTDHVPEAYRRYLANTFRKQLKLHGTPIRIEFRSGENPYDDPGKRSKPTRPASAKARRR